MSNLTSDLGNANSVATVTPGGGGGGGGDVVTGALSVLAQGVHGFSDMWTKQAQLKRQAATDARENASFQMKLTEYNQGQSDRAAGDLTIRSLNSANQSLYNPGSVGVPEPVDFTKMSTEGLGAVSAGLSEPAPSAVPTEISQSAMVSLTTGASKLQSFTTAASQGRMSSIAVQSQADMIINSLLTQHPEMNGSAIADVFKKLGVDNGLLRGIKSDEENYSEGQARAKAMRDAAVTEGSKWLSPDEAKTFTQDQIADIGQQHLLTDSQEKARMAALDYQTKVQSSQMSQYNDNKTLYSDQVQQIKHEAITSFLNPYVTQFINGTAPTKDAGSDAAYELERAKAVTLFQQKFEIGLNKIAATITDSSARDSFLKSERDNFKATYLDTFQSRDTSSITALKGITQYLGFKADLAMPMLSQMKAAGVRLGDIAPMLQALPKDTLSALSKEYAGIAGNKLDPDASKIVLNHMIGVLNGTDSLTNVNDPKLRQILVSTSANMILSQAQAVAAGKGDARSYSGTLKTLVLASASVNRSSPANVTRALGTIATNSNIAAINKLMSDQGTNPDGVELATGTRAAAAHLVANSTAALRGQVASEKYQIVRFDPANGSYKILFNDRQWAIDTKQNPGTVMAGDFGGAPMGLSGVATKPQPSTALQNLVASTNQGLNFLAHTSAWDKTAPESGEAHRDIANYYATGTLTPKMRQAQEKAAATKKETRTQTDILRTLNSNLQSHLADDIPTGTENADIVGPEGTGKNPRSSASGVGQFTDGTWVDTLKRHAPELIEGKTRADIIAMKQNKGLATRAVGWFRGDNAVHLGNNGITPTAQNTALAHFAGPEGAVNLLKANPAAPAETVLGHGAINANPQLKGKTVSEVIDWARKFYHA